MESEHDVPVGVYEVMQLQEFCQTCRSQIKRETIQECWEDLRGQCLFGNTETQDWILVNPKELKSKWGIEKWSEKA